MNMLYAIAFIIVLIIIAKMSKKDKKQKNTEVDYFNTKVQQENLKSLINDRVVTKKHFDPIKDSVLYKKPAEEKKIFLSLDQRVALMKEKNGSSKEQEPKRNFVKSVDFNNNQFKSPTRNNDVAPKRKKNTDLPDNYYDADLDLQMLWDSGYFNAFPDPYIEFFNRFNAAQFEKQQEENDRRHQEHDQQRQEQEFLQELKREEEKEESRLYYARHGQDDDIF